ncbi:heterokaryon incompatibility protein-domain-containing protein [Xylariaceae sp. FL1272]|nr:heterokaryon incompatibility protein-domain-containing protein [Xylariaceae sp. FL1272]
MNTLIDFKKNIPWRELSKTFQDAVDICQKLQIDYIWIDSLCIIQDDDKDWREQSVQMADIFENAHLTIAATKSPDGNGGCYAVVDLECRGLPVIEGSIYACKRTPKFDSYSQPSEGHFSTELGSTRKCNFRQEFYSLEPRK